MTASRSPFAAAERKLYAWLAGMSHPNFQATRYYVVPLPKRQAMALAYGGWFAPKSAGQIATQFLFAPLVFLEAFYQIYRGDLEAQGLLWRSETLDMLKETPKAQSVGWPQLLAIFRSMATELVQHYNSLPDDAISLSLHFDELGVPAPEGPENHQESESE